MRRSRSLSSVGPNHAPRKRQPSPIRQHRQPSSLQQRQPSPVRQHQPPSPMKQRQPSPTRQSLPSPLLQIRQTSPKSRHNRQFLTTPPTFYSRASLPLGQLNYPEPTQEWQAEVATIQEQVLKLRQLETDNEENRIQQQQASQTQMEYIYEVFKSSLMEIKKDNEDAIIGVLQNLQQDHIKMMIAMENISNERCDALNKIFEARLGQNQSDRTTDNSSYYNWNSDTRSRIQQLEEENKKMKMELETREIDRGLREKELKKLCVEQAAELDEMRSHGTDIRDLGIEVMEITDHNFNPEEENVLEIARCSTQALEAGIHSGDIINYVSTMKRVFKSRDLDEAIRNARTGDIVHFSLVRGGKRIERELLV